MKKRERIIGFGGAGVLVVLGLAGGIGFGGTFGQVLAIVLISLGLVLAVALVFYEVGLSEDRERAREEQERREQDEARKREGAPRRRIRVRRLERRRGERRRLD